MYPATHAALRPGQLATVMAGSGESVTYAELDSSSNRCAHYLRRLGLRVGDHIAILLENHPRFHEICWAAQRSGLYYTAVNWHLRPDEVGAVVRSCGARVLFTSQVLAATAVALLECVPDMSTRLMLDGVATGYRSYEEATAPLPAEPISDEVEGADLLYSSGTTGRPKGVRVPLSGRHPAEPSPARERLSDLSGFGADTVFLATAPLYHAASLGWSLRVHRRGGTVVVMERFDPEAALAAIERHQVTHAHVVPTMFVRLLRLPADVRRRYDLSSLRSVAHSAGPCVPAVKEQMIAWWGPIIDELYGGTERNGLTFITSPEWLAHRGSVGRPVYGHVHILDEAGRELPPGDVGTVYFGGGGSFEYLGDPEGTARSLGPNGWTTIGDLGYVDADGYLYLAGRRDRIIVSGGVNIQPQELEDVLSAYPGVTDAAVLGVPDEELGTRVAALAVPAEPVTSPERAAGLVEALQAHCHRHLAGFKCPRTIDLVPDLPRDTTGKLPEERLRAVYCDLKSAHPASRRRARTPEPRRRHHRKGVSMTATSPRQLPDTEEVAGYLRERRNWGRWGEDDQQGAVNLITADKRVRSAALVRSGQAISLSRNFPTAPAPGNPKPAEHHTYAVDRPHGGGAATDYYGINYHGFSCTHLDALCHVWDEEGMWNGRDPREHIQQAGVSWGGVEQWSDGIITRGVLLDVAGHRGVPYVSPDRPVHGWELAEVAAAQGVRVEPGDALVVHSGREAWASEHPLWPEPTWLRAASVRPGLHASCLPFIRDHDIALVAWDMMDCYPSGYDLPWTVHGALCAYGVALVDNALLTPLTEACRRQGRYEFLFLVAPLRVVGGTGSPVNPLAVL